MGNTTTKWHKYSKSKKGIAEITYREQIRNSKKRNHDLPTYTKEWFVNWILNDSEFNRLYDIWKENNYLKDLKPSCDRINANKSYLKDNIQIITWAENKRKGELDKKYGIVKGDSKPVNQYTKNMDFIASYHSISEADRQTGIDFRNISAVLNGKRKTTGGFIWRFKIE